MMSLTAAVLLVSNLTTYPAFGDKVPKGPLQRQQLPRIEARVDRGPIVELIVRCGHGTAIVSYSKIDRRYCTPKFHCGHDLPAIVNRTCR